MTLNDLIERLEEYRNAMGGDCDVRLMTQQHWPFEYAITGLTSGAELNDPDDDDAEDVDDDHAIYIVEGSQLGYGSKRAWELAH